MIVKMEILEEVRNDLIGRREVTALAVFDEGTPSKSAVIESLARQLQAPRERIALVRIDPYYGFKKATIRFRVYDSEDTLKLMEPRYILARQGLVEAKKKG